MSAGLRCHASQATADGPVPLPPCHDRYQDYARAGADATAPALARLIQNNSLSLTSVDVSRNRLTAEGLGYIERTLLKLPFRSTTLRELRVDDNADEAARVAVYVPAASCVRSTLPTAAHAARCTHCARYRYHAFLRALCIPHGDLQQQMQQFTQASNATLMRLGQHTGAGTGSGGPKSPAGAPVTFTSTPTSKVHLLSTPRRNARPSTLSVSSFGSTATLRSHGATSTGSGRGGSTGSPVLTGSGARSRSPSTGSPSTGAPAGGRIPERETGTSAGRRTPGNERNSTGVVL